MVPTLKCLDVGDHICALVYTTSQIKILYHYSVNRLYISHRQLIQKYLLHLKLTRSLN